MLLVKYTITLLVELITAAGDGATAVVYAERFLACP